MGARETAESFSGHRFDEAYGQLHEDVRWTVPGHEPIIGKAAVVEACEETAEHMAGLALAEFTRFVVVADDRVAAVDAIGRYVSHDGTTSVVSSADVYELDADGLVTTITSYAVELDA
jgi:ketosteroid isomerase-like protein